MRKRKPYDIHTLFLPHSGPTWEFQPCLKSCNLASWTTKWYDFQPDYQPPNHQPLGQKSYLKEPNTFLMANSWCLAGVLKVSRGCLECLGKVSEECMQNKDGVQTILGQCLYGKQRMFQLEDRANRDRSTQNRSSQERSRKDKSTQERSSQGMTNKKGQVKSRHIMSRQDNSGQFKSGQEKS